MARLPNRSTLTVVLVVVGAVVVFVAGCAAIRSTLEPGADRGGGSVTSSRAP